MEFFFNTSHKLAQFCIHLYFEWMIFEIMQSVYIYIPDRLHNIAFLEHIKSALQNVLIKIRFRGIKKDPHFQFILKMNGLSRFFYSVEWWKYYFAFDVFPKPQSNTTDTFTQSEFAFLYIFRSLWSNLKNLSKCRKSRGFTNLSDVVQLLSLYAMSCQ